MEGFGDYGRSHCGHLPTRFEPTKWREEDLARLLMCHPAPADGTALPVSARLGMTGDKQCMDPLETQRLAAAYNQIFPPPREQK